MYQADRLYNELMEADKAVRALKVKDEATVAEYVWLHTQLIYDHKELGNVFDLYADDAQLRRENGLCLNGAHAIMKEALKLTAAFPDMKLQLRDRFAVKKGKEYKVFLYYSMSGTNKNASLSGPATKRALEGDKCISMTMATLQEIGGRWRIVREFTMHSMECLKAACRPETDI